MVCSKLDAAIAPLCSKLYPQVATNGMLKVGNAPSCSKVDPPVATKSMLQVSSPVLFYILPQHLERKTTTINKYTSIDPNQIQQAVLH